MPLMDYSPNVSQSVPITLPFGCSAIKETVFLDVLLEHMAIPLVSSV
jgi:hypothetical protein